MAAEQEFTLILAGFDPSPEAGQPHVVGPTVSYSGEERPLVHWKENVGKAVESLPAGPIRVKGRAPHGVYAWVGKFSGAGRELRLEQNGLTYTLPGVLFFEQFGLCGKRVTVLNGAEDGARVFFLSTGPRQMELGDADREALEKDIGCTVSTVQYFDTPGPITPELFPGVVSELNGELTTISELSSPKDGPLVFITNGPTCLAAAVGRILRLSKMRVLVMERRMREPEPPAAKEVYYVAYEL